MADRAYHKFDDPEGNFLEQFQTDGFNARLFELYLFAYFTYSGLQVDRSSAQPDFIVTHDELVVAIEATTTNPSTSGALSTSRKKISELSDSELREYIDQELPIRFGGPIYSKLKKKYWQLKHCKNIPLVIAIEAFHGDESLSFSESALATYLYGLKETISWDREGEPRIQREKVNDHNVGNKSIPSCFFAQADAEHISAILFCNSGTFAKFARMGYQYGIGEDVIHIIHSGSCHNPDAKSFDPTFFSYPMSDPPFVEHWGDGLVVIHNPNCLYPIPRGYFPYAVDLYLENDIMAADVSGRHTISSKTLIMHLDRKTMELKNYLPFGGNRWTIEAISPQEFRALSGSECPPVSVGQEHGWFADEARGFLGIVVQDHTDRDWGYLVLARDENYHFRAIDVVFSFPSRDRAIIALHVKLLERLASPRRIFIHDELSIMEIASSLTAISFLQQAIGLPDTMPPREEFVHSKAGQNENT